MRGLIDAIGAQRPARRAERTDEYGALVRSIVGQQLSTKAARSIYGRLTDRFGGRAPTPREVLADDPEDLRAAVGLSRAKVTYLRSLPVKPDTLGATRFFATTPFRPGRTPDRAGTRSG